MRLRCLALVGLVVLGAPGCKRFFSFGRPDAGGTGSGSGGGGLLSTFSSLVGFEGEIDMEVTMGSVPSTPSPSAFAMTMNMKLKGDKMRMDISMPGLSVPGATGSTIMDTAKKKSWTLMPTTKEYMETDLDPKTKPTPVAPGPKPVITKTGRTDKVAGYSCEITTVTHPGTPGRSELCLTKGLTLFGLGGGPFSKLGSDSEWGDALKDGFPLRMETYDASGALTVKLETTRIEKKSQSDSDFEIPPGYKKMATPSYGYPPPPPPTGGTGGSGGYTF